MKRIVVLCRNSETILSTHSVGGYPPDSDFLKTIFDMLPRIWSNSAACALHGDFKRENNSTFYDWNGGRFDQSGYRAGCIWCDDPNPPQWLKDIIDKANDAGQASLDERIKK